MVNKNVRGPLSEAARKYHEGYTEDSASAILLSFDDALRAALNLSAEQELMLDGLRHELQAKDAEIERIQNENFVRHTDMEFRLMKQLTESKARVKALEDALEKTNLALICEAAETDGNIARFHHNPGMFSLWLNKIQGEALASTSPAQGDEPLEAVRVAQDRCKQVIHNASYSANKAHTVRDREVFEIIRKDAVAASSALDKAFGKTVHYGDCYAGNCEQCKKSVGKVGG